MRPEPPVHTATAIRTITTARHAVDDLPGRLADAGFTGAEVAARLDERDILGVLANLAWHSLVHAHTAEPPTGPPDVLLPLFVLGMPVPFQHLESPCYGLADEAIRTRTLDGRNALVRGQSSRDALCDHLNERKVRESIPAVVEFTIT